MSMGNGAPTQNAAARRYRFARGLGVVGVLLILGGVVASLAVKRVAAGAALAANAHTSLVSCGPGSNPLALCFPASVGHPLVAPDYAGLWLPIVVGVIGAAVVATATVIAVRSQREA